MQVSLGVGHTRSLESLRSGGKYCYTAVTFYFKTMEMLTEKDAQGLTLDGKTVAVIGYGAQGRAQAIMMHKSGVKVVVGVREKGSSWHRVMEDGLTVAPIAEAVAAGDIVHILIPDEVQGQVWTEQVEPNLKADATLSFSHGFNIIFKHIAAPAGNDVIMVAPKSPGTEELKEYERGFGVPALIAIHQNATGNAKNTALAMCDAMNFTKAGVLECTFGEETYEDLFGEQAVLCGGVVELMKAGFETLTEAGYPPAMAYFECLHEMKLIIDLVYEGGIEHMYAVVSNTAEYGGRTVGPRVIGAEAKAAMKDALNRVESGEFAKEWIADYQAGMPTMSELRESGKKHPIEIEGAKVRALFQKG